MKILKILFDAKYVYIVCAKYILALYQYILC